MMDYLNVSSQLFNELQRCFPDVPPNVIMSILVQHSNDRQFCMTALARESQNFPSRTPRRCTSGIEQQPNAGFHLADPRRFASCSNLRKRSDSLESSSSMSSTQGSISSGHISTQEGKDANVNDSRRSDNTHYVSSLYHHLPRDKKLSKVTESKLTHSTSVETAAPSGNNGRYSRVRSGSCPLVWVPGKVSCQQPGFVTRQTSMGAVSTSTLMMAPNYQRQVTSIAKCPSPARNPSAYICLDNKNKNSSQANYNSEHLRYNISTTGHRYVQPMQAVNDDVHSSYEDLRDEKLSESDYDDDTCSTLSPSTFTATLKYPAQTNLKRTFSSECFSPMKQNGTSNLSTPIVKQREPLQKVFPRFEENPVFRIRNYATQRPQIGKHDDMNTDEGLMEPVPVRIFSRGQSCIGHFSNNNNNNNLNSPDALKKTKSDRYLYGTCQKNDITGFEKTLPPWKKADQSSISKQSVSSTFHGSNIAINAASPAQLSNQPTSTFVTSVFLSLSKPCLSRVDMRPHSASRQDRSANALHCSPLLASQVNNFPNGKSSKSHDNLTLVEDAPRMSAVINKRYSAVGLRINENVVAHIGHQKQKLDCLEYNLNELLKYRNSLQETVSSLEEESSKSKHVNKSIFPNVEDLDELKRKNSCLQQDIFLMTRHLDSVGNGEVTLDDDESLEEMSFYRNNPTGQRWSYNPSYDGRTSSSSTGKHSRAY